MDLNSSLTSLNISDLMGRIAMISNVTEKINILNAYVKELNAEMLKIKNSEFDSSLCILVLTEAIQKLEKEILWYKTNAATLEVMPLQAVDPKEKDKESLEKSSDADEEDQMCFIQLGSNNIASNTTKQRYASHDSSSGLIEEDVSARENPKSETCINYNRKKSAFVPYQRPLGVIIRENSNISNDEHFSGGMFGLSSFNLNFSGSSAPQLTYQTSYLVDSSKKPRLRWTHDLHRKFVRVVDELGGATVATPKKITEKMQIDNLTDAEVKSHLQKYRFQIQRQQLASNPGSGAPSTSTGQGYQVNKST